VSYLSLYRKYRSQTFGDLIGQDHVVRTLKNGIESGRIAHAYLFTGPRGTGKTSTARLLAKSLCCEGGPKAEPDIDSPICREIAEGSFVDVIEMDAASDSGVDEIREKIVDIVEYKPLVAPYKVFIIDEVHDLSGKAFDALLKTIEEPPPHIVFVLATTEYHKVPPTIRSRCQKFEFHRASMADLVSRLDHVVRAEGIEAEEGALRAIARMADGGFRDALTLLEQAVITSDGRITLDQVYDQLGMVSEDATDGILSAMHAFEVPKLVELLDEVARRGRDPRAILESLLFRLADLTRASYQVTESESDAVRDAAMHETAARLGRDFVLRVRGALAEAHLAIRDVTLPRLWLESELIRIAAPKAVASQPAQAPAGPVKRSEPKATTQDAVNDLLSTVKESAAAKPKPTEPKADEPAVAASSGGTDLASVWAKLLERMNAEFQGTPFPLKLLGSSVQAGEGAEVVVQLGRVLDVDWFSEKPARRAHVEKLLGECGAPGKSLKFVAVKRQIEDAPVKTVELPAEGQRLVERAKEVFGIDSALSPEDRDETP
jgi:DNA polymerase-3 subunit gamma/tau